MPELVLAVGDGAEMYVCGDPVKLTAAGPLVAASEINGIGPECMMRCPRSITVITKGEPTSVAFWTEPEGLRKSIVIDASLLARFHHALFVILECDGDSTVTFSIPGEEEAVFEFGQGCSQQ
ncbi:MAG: hypothetical protein KF883_13915 [Thermomicrobiales bacterium]|nr:hypothetical protein [Thermomicrobiales bacterium]